MGQKFGCDLESLPSLVGGAPGSLGMQGVGFLAWKQPLPHCFLPARAIFLLQALPSGNTLFTVF